MSGTLEFVILGCGSSGGVPRGDGEWGACDPAQPRNRRSRCSLLVRRWPDVAGEGEATTVLIDTSPDLRQQLLAARVARIDGVLYTHDHADQTHGIDDIRVFYLRQRQRIPCWMDAATHETLMMRFGYVFTSAAEYPAICEPRPIPGHGLEWSVDGPGGAMPVTTFDQAHGAIRSVGYRIGPVAYSSDVSGLDDRAFEEIAKADVWIVDALRWTPHPTHAHVDRALEWISRSGVRRAILTNLHIDLDYNALSAAIPDNVEVAFDGLRFDIPA